MPIAYGLAPAHEGDALHISHLTQPNFKSCGREMVKKIWKVMLDDADPIGRVDYKVLATLLRAFIIEEINQIAQPDLSAGAKGLPALLTELGNKYAFRNLMKVFRPEDALRILVHSLIQQSTARNWWE